MAALDPQAHIAMLERELQWAHLTIEKRDAQIRQLEERLRQRRIQVLGPHSETLSDLQLELLAEEEPGATRDEVEAEARPRTASTQARRANANPIRAAAVAGESAAHRTSDCRAPSRTAKPAARKRPSSVTTKAKCWIMNRRAGSCA